jgi:hypothetical protein
MAKIKLAKARGETPKPFRMKCRSAQSPTQTLVVNSKHWTSKRTKYISYNDVKDLNPREPLPEKLPGDCRILRTRWGKWFFVLCLPLSVREEDQAMPECDNRNDVDTSLAGVAAIDPGVRTFNAVYDAGEGAFFEWGAQDFKRINRLCRATDKLQSLAACREREKQHLERVSSRQCADPQPSALSPQSGPHAAVWRDKKKGEKIKKRRCHRRDPKGIRHRERYIASGPAFATLSTTCTRR